MKCRFTATYYDGLERKVFRCENDAIEDGYCIFHHPDCREDSNKIIDNFKRYKFKKIIKEKLNKNEDLIFVGHNLPDFNFADILKDALITENTKNEENAENLEVNVKVFFDHCKFQNANFSNVVFKKEVSFRDAEFKEGVFVDTKFEKDVYFNYAKFDYACFIVAEFNRGADFHRAKLDKADFSASSFKKVANFWGTLFKVVDFEMAKFEDFTVFEESTLEWAKFKDVTFKAADFTDVVFKLLLFIRTTFEDIAMFKLKDLEELENELEETRAQAGYCHICEQYECKMEFERLEKRRELLRDESRFAVFNLVAFKHPENVWFIDFPLSNTSFLLTDISKTIMIANFDDKTLSDKLLKKPQKCDECMRKNYCEIRYMKRDHILNMFIDIKHTLPECEALKILQPHLKQETVLAEYRNLRKAFENSRTYQEASNLFVKEMKLLGESLKCDTPSIRRQLEVGIERAFHGIYNLFSYGESIGRPIIIILLVLFCFHYFYAG